MPSSERDETVKATMEKAGDAAVQKPRQVEIPPTIAVRQLAEMLDVTPVDAIKQLMRAGVMANINQVIDFKTASAVAAGFGVEAKLRHRTAAKAGRTAELKKPAR